jgi:hypothetical protein
VASLFEIGILIVSDIFLFLPESNFLRPSVKQEILGQSWIFLGSHPIFVPKWGVTFPETQELCFFIFLSFLLLEIYQKRVPAAPVWPYRLLKVIYLCTIVITGSKGVLIGILVYLFFRNKRNLQIKLLAMLCVVFPAIYYLVHRATYDSGSFVASALSYNSIDERIFHIIFFFKLCAAHPIHLLIGFGARQHGQLISGVYPLDFTHLTNAVSLFSIVTDSGLIGFACYLAIPIGIFLAIRGYRERLSIVSAFIANIGIPDWSLDCYIIFMLIILVTTHALKSKEGIYQDKTCGLAVAIAKE